MARTKDGWTLVAIHQKIHLGKKDYRNMEEWKRPCRVCNQDFYIYTRENAVQVNAAFGLRTCKHHRGMSSGQVVPIVQEVPSGLQAQYDAQHSTLIWQEGELQRLYARVEQLEAELGIHKPPSLNDFLNGAKPLVMDKISFLPWPPKQG